MLALLWAKLEAHLHSNGMVQYRCSWSCCCCCLFALSLQHESRLNKTNFVSKQKITAWSFCIGLCAHLFIYSCRFLALKVRKIVVNIVASRRQTDNQLLCSALQNLKDQAQVVHFTVTAIIAIVCLYCKSRWRQEGH